MRVVSLASVLAIAIGVLWVAPASAGGWAVTTLDALPTSIEAGQTYQVGYMIRQHGVTPYAAATPVIHIDMDGQRLSFPGHGEGVAGHFVSQVKFPGEGTWTWSVDQTPFATQPLGTLQIVAPPVAAVTTQLEPHPAASWTADDSRMIPWAWGWLAVGGVLVLAFVGRRFKPAE